VVVDRVEDAANWVSVLAWGTFRELADGSAAQALRLISERLRTVALADAAPGSAERSYVGRTGRDGVTYRIAIAERTGRFSKS
jgi:nitroimidazol reductase NimA-like FMN-containing flavoprotein (pyridoxamine 5'-phosphate oxidase superfamily)